MTGRATRTVRAPQESPAYPSRTKHRLATRDRVFTAALAEFRRVGVAAAQIEHIVRAAGVARGTFYLHFPTKDDVLIELMRRKQRILVQRLDRVRSSAPAAFLCRTVDVMLEDAREEDAALLHDLFAVIGRHAPEMQSDESAFVGALTGFFEASRQRGEIRADCDPVELTAMFLPGVYGLLHLTLHAPGAEQRRTLYRAVDTFVRGIQPADTEETQTEQRKHPRKV
jgi:TetR/AcrR family transcriptional repressor of uid operon